MSKKQVTNKQRPARKFKTGPHYRIVLFYARSYVPEFNTLDAAMRKLKARALTSHARHYAELWKMDNEYDGEQVGCYECSEESLELIRK